MSEQTAAFRKVFEYELLEAETKVKYYRSLLGLPPVESNTKYAEENTRLLQCVAQQKSENEVLHRKVGDLASKLCKAHRECAKLRNELKIAKEEMSAYYNKNIKSTDIFKNPKGFWSGESEPKEGELVFESVAGIVRIIPFSKDDRLKEQE